MQSNLSNLLEPRNLKKHFSYINPSISKDDVNSLADAINQHDKNKIRQIVANNTREGYITRIMAVPEYEPFVEQFAMVIVDNNRSLLEEKAQTYAKAGAYKPIVEDKPRKLTRPIKQKQKSGKEYERESPKKFSEIESNFFKRTKSLPLKAVVMRYNQAFPYRSYSSLKTKRKRLLRKK